MDELISKNKLRQEALSIGGHLYSDWDTGGVLALIARQPKVEAKAIEYAHWVYDPDGLDWGLGAWVCSSCHMKNDNIPVPALNPDIARLNPLLYSGSKFCPNCGKTMINAEDDKENENGND